MLHKVCTLDTGLVHMGIPTGLIQTKDKASLNGYHNILLNLLFMYNDFQFMCTLAMSTI